MVWCHHESLPVPTSAGRWHVRQRHPGNRQRDGREGRHQEVSHRAQGISLSALRTEQNGCDYADNIYKYILWNKNLGSFNLNLNGVYT